MNIKQTILCILIGIALTACAMGCAKSPKQPATAQAKAPGQAATAGTQPATTVIQGYVPLPDPDEPKKK